MGIGFIAGLAILSRGTVLPFFCLVMIWLFWKGRKNLLSVMRFAVAFSLGVSLTVAPLLLRGYLRYGKIVPLRTDTGANLWYGNHPGASGTSYIHPLSPVTVTSQLSPELSTRLKGKNEVEQNQIFIDAVLRFARENPQAVLFLFFKKFYYFWWSSPYTGLLYPALWYTVYTLYYVILLPFSILGILTSIKSKNPTARTGVFLFLLMAGSVSVMQAIFYVEGRHRWQIEPLLLVFSAAGLLNAFKSLRRLRLR
jgi:hypothetical protein